MPARAVRRHAVVLGVALAVAVAVLAWSLAIPMGGGALPAAAQQPQRDAGASNPQREVAEAAASTQVAPAVAVAAGPGSAQIKLTLRASGLSKPVFITTPRDGTGRQFIVEQTGKIKIYKDQKVLATPFLDLTGKVSRGSEQGLLGLAFHPNFGSNRKLYVDFTRPDGDTIIREYKVSASNPNVVDPSTKRRILHVVQPYDNHNGGGIGFGPDGYLYIGMGDGGSAGDPGNRAQSKSTLLGKLLRIDINGTSGSRAYRIPATNPFAGDVPGYGQIWEYGLRNPWRWSFDSATGDLWIGDVGQNSWEEIDHAVRSGSPAGKGVNWGWNVLEGTHCYPPGTTSCSTSGKRPPLLEYDHGGGRCAVTGGYVYRGAAIPALVGGYVFGDYCSGEIWVVPANATAPATPTLLLDTNLLISSFGVNGKGELMVTDLQGRLYNIQQG